LTYGTGAQTREHSYPAVLAELSGLNVINAGVPGEISAEGLARIDRYLMEAAPDLVILCHGGNDMIRKLDQSQLRRNLANMIKKIRSSGAEVVLLSVPRPGIWLDAAPVYQQVAETYNVVVDNDIIADVESDPALKSDPIHPNTAGYHLVAERLFDLLKRHGAVLD
jgi:lysophospholipase L1-like esterase